MPAAPPALDPATLKCRQHAPLRMLPTVAEGTGRQWRRSHWGGGEAPTGGRVADLRPARRRDQRPAAGVQRWVARSGRSPHHARRADQRPRRRTSTRRTGSCATPLPNPAPSRSRWVRRRRSLPTRQCSTSRSEATSVGCRRCARRCGRGPLGRDARLAVRAPRDDRDGPLRRPARRGQSRRWLTTRRRSRSPMSTCCKSTEIQTRCVGGDRSPTPRSGAVGVGPRRHRARDHRVRPAPGSR